jgi:hypothetical protein
MNLVTKFTDTHLVTLYIEISFGVNKKETISDQHLTN